MKKQIVINHTKHEIKVAILEDGVVSEIFYERDRDKSVVGKVFKGKVLKVLPGMESAFIDIGLDKAAFLYVDDIRPKLVDIDMDEDFEDKDEPEKKPTRKSEKSKQKITALLKEGQDIMVQASKGSIGSKGARVTCNISLPGRNLVFMPHVNNVGVSKQIREERERSRLRKIVANVKPEKSGFIVRTVAAGRSEEEFKNDIEYLVNCWKESERKFRNYQAPAVLFDELNLTFRTIRDMLAPDVDALIIDDPIEHDRIKRYLDAYLPRYSSKLRLFSKKETIFDHFGITREINKAMSRKVWLKSGGHLVIDQSEALTAIDVNTGRFTGSSNHEDTILTTNLDAIVEIVRQLKLRDIGGIIIIDFIDMESAENRQKVYSTLKEELKKDKAKTKILPVSEIGLVEMTRKRNRENLGTYLRTVCPYCNGASKIFSPTTVVYEIYQDIDRLVKSSDPPKSILLGLHPDVADYLENEEMDIFRSMEKLIRGSIFLQTSEKYHCEQYEIMRI